ncbi:hypothetical protein [Marinobacterium mangrovicola]|uniref:Uncharacterized protein n=1 Tax=Marinobacterium mangrovicola TaxID=1476959 RepID=A0A4R1GXG2_9GAMM|nr:hypothetical protein [Marinobacterium mangrovicola]TCK09132.1 hypothetical protein CLV83_1235 [Marinobacterium mangrovicola]
MDSRTKQPVKAQISKFLIAADWRLSRALHWCFTTICFLGLLALGGVSLTNCYMRIFEYQDAWYDLSLAEWVFFLLAIALTTRLVFIAKRGTARWWHSPVAFLKLMGTFSVIEAVIISFAVAIDYFNANDSSLSAYFTFDELHGDKVLLGLVLISLYMSTPPVPRAKGAANEVEVEKDAEDKETEVEVEEEVEKTKSAQTETEVEAEDVKDAKASNDPWMKDTPYSSTN